MSEWNKTVLETLDSVVDGATNKIVRPAHRIARYSVYGIVAVTLALIIAFFLVIVAFRATSLAMPVYGSYLVWGGIFLAIGTLLWVKK